VAGGAVPVADHVVSEVGEPLELFLQRQYLGGCAVLVTTRAVFYLVKICLYLM
jgi:hypothetical protein